MGISLRAMAEFSQYSDWLRQNMSRSFRKLFPLKLEDCE
jgi:hypothetical protein